MKTLFTALVILAVAGAASACVNTPKPCGPLDLMVYPDGSAAIINNGDVAFGFDGYTILSTAGLVPPGTVVGIVGNTNANPTGFPPSIGYVDDYTVTPPFIAIAACYSWSPLANTANNWTEATLTAPPATMQPGDTINLGPGFDGLDNVDGTFTYVDSTLPEGQTSFEGHIIPEPTTMTLLGLGVVALIRRRR